MLLRFTCQPQTGAFMAVLAVSRRCFFTASSSSSTATVVVTTAAAVMRTTTRTTPTSSAFRMLSGGESHHLPSLFFTRGGLSSSALLLSRRFTTNTARSGGKDTDLVDQEKPIHIRVAEEKDSQIYTYTEYVERQEQEERAAKTIAQTVDEVRDNPIWMLWGLALLSLAVLTVAVSIRVRREQMRFDPKLRAVKSFDSDDGPSIGGPFCLTDVNTGKTVTEQDFKGKWMYIYFGFTNCPDVCPEEMEKMSRVISHLDAKVGKDYWQPIFISLDPKRDSPAVIRQYLADFSPRILGLVGSTEAVEEAARQYRVYFAIPDEEVMSDDDYLVDHSIIMYLMDPEGRFCDYTTKEFQWFESYSKLLRRMMDHEKEKQLTQQPSNDRVANVASVTAPATAESKA